RHAVAQDGERTRAGDFFQRRRRLAGVFEIRRVAAVRAVFVPLEGEAFGRLDGLPLRRTFEDVAVTLAEHLWRQGTRERLADLVVGRPDVFQIDRLAVFAGAKRVFGQVEL